MSAPPQLRRKDKMMADERAHELLARGFCGRIATVGADGWPYCVPLLYVWEAGQVFDYGRFECDTSVAYRSVVVFGTIRIVEDVAAKTRFFDALMAKYGR